MITFSSLTSNIDYQTKQQMLQNELSKTVEKKMPLLGFGTFIGLEHEQIADVEDRQRVVEESVFNALQAGYRHLDCASNYGNLVWVGNALKKAFQPLSEGGLGLKREDIWITSKDKRPSEENLKKTLNALGLNDLDLYLIHFPHSNIKVIWHEMNALVDKGIVKNIGVSNFYHSHMEQLLTICQEKGLRIPYADEIEISPWVQEGEFNHFCQRNKIRLIAYSPLGYANSSVLLGGTEIVEEAMKLNATAAQVALAWNMARGVAVIPSSRNQQHIKSNYSALNLVMSIAQDEKFMHTMQDLDMNLCTTEIAEKYKNESYSTFYG